MKNYIEVCIKTEPKNFNAVMNVLYKSEVDNILEEKEDIKVYFFEEDKALANEIKKCIITDGIPAKVSLNVFEERNWNEEWEKTIEPIFINDKLVIYPSWKSNELRDRKDIIKIEIDPKMAFGTGHNETTRLVLKQLYEYIEPEDGTLLDFGTGTGILSIAAVKLGIKSAIGIDIDRDAIINAKENIKVNKVDDCIRLYNYSIDDLPEKDFDIITANIIRSVIASNISHIKNKLKSRGKIFISGILRDEKEQMEKILEENNFEIIEIISEAEWLGIYAKNIC